MNYNLNQCIEHLNKGIEYKRNGDSIKALDEYRKAREIYPTYKQIYNNLGKLYFVDPRTNDLILRSFLTYAHLTMVQDNYDINNIEFARQNGFYDYSGKYLEGKIIRENLAYQRIQDHRNLGKIYSDVNLTFNVGLAYLLRKREIIAYNNIDVDLIINHTKILMGKEVYGKVLGDSEFAPLVRNLGFFFLTNNIVTNDNNSEIFIANVYFRDDFPIDEV